MFIMAKSNLTVGAFSVFGQGFIEVDGQTVPELKSLKRLAAIMADYGPFNLKFHLPESGQLGVLTETGYRDGVLGLMQEGKVELCILPMALDTQKVPGQFTPVISEESYYIHSIRTLGGGTAAFIDSFISVNTIPILLAILIVFLLELAVVKCFNIESIFNAIYQSFGTSFYQNLSRHSTCTQTIVGNNEVKIETLRDVITYDKTPFYFEGISMYDWFKAKVTKDYGDIYERSKSKGFEKPYPLGLFRKFRPADRMVTFVSALGIKIAPLGAAVVHEPNQYQHISERPFHRSVQALLLSFETPESTKKRVHFITQRIAQAGISEKLEADVYVEFILRFYPASLFDFYKFQIPRNSLEVNWKSLNFRTFCEIFYGYIALLVLVLIVQLIELLSVLLFKRQRIRNETEELGSYKPNFCTVPIFTTESSEESIEGDSEGEPELEVILESPKSEEYDGSEKDDIAISIVPKDDDQLNEVSTNLPDLVNPSDNAVNESEQQKTHFLDLRNHLILIGAAYLYNYYMDASNGIFQKIFNSHFFGKYFLFIANDSLNSPRA
uniref:Ionotropic glutamate receptor C-terminal domain-containing protein n=1 Tax=Tetranychus urticae TaxID=32264 RepID=T1KYJ1_TETUR